MKIGRRPVFITTTIIRMCTGVWLGFFQGTVWIYISILWALRLVLHGRRRPDNHVWQSLAQASGPQVEEVACSEGDLVMCSVSNVLL